MYHLPFIPAADLQTLHIETKNSKVVPYLELLAEDEHGNQGIFCETIRGQVLY